MDYQLLIFDWDGTLMDSESRIVSCLSNAIEDLQLPQREAHELSNVIGLALGHAFESLYPELPEEEISRLVQRYRYHFLEASQVPSPLFANVPETLEQLRHEGFQLAIATGKGRPGLDRVLHETGMAGLFSASRCADESLSKPDPAMVIEILEELSVPPEHALVIGDTEYDLQMAANAQVDSVAVSYGVHSVDRLLQHQPKLVIDEITELRNWLDLLRTNSGTFRFSTEAMS